MQEQPQVMTSQWKAEEKTLEIDGVMLTGNKSFKGKLEADKNKLLGKKKINILGKLSKLEIANQRVLCSLEDFRHIFIH